MSKSDKKLERMRNNPRGDWILDDLKGIAKRYGITVRHEGGSHATFSHPDIADILTVPARRPVKAPYIRAFIALLEELEADDEAPRRK